MRYVSNQVISFSIRVKGKNESRRVSFTSQSTGGSTFTTDIPVLIEALESSPMYNSLYYRAAECIGASIRNAKTVKTAAKKKIVEEVTDWQDAIEYLSKFNVDCGSLSSPDKILEEAANLGIEFPNLRTKG